MTQPDRPSVRQLYPELFEGESPAGLETFVEKLDQYYAANQPPARLARFNPANYAPVITKRRRFGGWRRVLAAALAVLLLALGVLLAIPQTRASLAGWFGFTIEQRTNSGFIVSSTYAQWASPDAKFVYNIIGIPQDRWNFSQKWPAPRPVAGSRTVLPGNKILTVPSYLPEGYRWQTAALPQTNLTISEPHFWSTSSRGGGGSPSYDLTPVNFDSNMALYLIGGNPANDLLLVSQFDMIKNDEILIYPFVVGVTAPANYTPPPSPDSPSLAPLNMPGYQPAQTELGLLAQAAPGQHELKLEIGATTRHETTVKGFQAFWYEGTWDYQGKWVTEGGWVSLVWKQNDILFQVTGQNLPYTELLKVAESLPER